MSTLENIRLIARASLNGDVTFHVLCICLINHELFSIMHFVCCIYLLLLLNVLEMTHAWI